MVAGALQLDLLDLDLKRLTAIRRIDELAGHAQRAAGRILGHFLKVLEIDIIDQLHIAEIGPIIELDEAQLSAAAVGADPPLKLHILDRIELDM